MALDMSPERLVRVFENIRRRLPTKVPDADIRDAITALHGHGGQAYSALEAKHGLSWRSMIPGGGIGSGRPGRWFQNVKRTCNFPVSELLANCVENPLELLRAYLLDPEFIHGPAHRDLPELNERYRDADAFGIPRGLSS